LAHSHIVSIYVQTDLLKIIKIWCWLKRLIRNILVGGRSKQLLKLEYTNDFEFSFYVTVLEVYANSKELLY